MARLPLKEYQRESLDVLGRYCKEVAGRAKGDALRPERDAFEVVTGTDYYAPDAFEGVPYVCMRLPTGGGKTLIAAHGVGTIGRHLAHNDRPLCLWVTPTTTIRDQTLKGLKDRSHPYHIALRESVNRPFQVLTIEEAQYVNKAMMSADAVVIVTTIQSYRIDEEANRKVYQDNGYLMDHFENLPAWAQQRLDRDANGGQVSLSLANAMRLRGPIVIMDESHNARTKTSFESLARFGPLAVLELTATPQQVHDPAKEIFASNVLHAVSALQLQREGMVKLPVELESREEWLQVLEATIQKREGLARLCTEHERDTGRYIRPIALIQAQPNRKGRETHTAEKVKEALVDRFKLPAEAVRLATGAKDELDGEDLMARESPVEYIVTVDKLREGWDCPFAYVLGSIGNVATETAVEQLLGRVLRMPGAAPTGIPELDRAYAIVQSKDVLKTAAGLRDSLVKRCGFDADSVADAFRVTRAGNGQGTLPVGGIPMMQPPAVDTLPDSVRLKVEYDEGASVLRVHTPLSREEAQAVRDVTQTLPDREAVESYWLREREVGTAAKALDDYAEPIRVPQLTVRDGEQVLLFEPEELDEFDWALDSCDPVLTDADFDLTWRAGDRIEIGTDDKGGTRIGSVSQVLVTQLALLDEGDDWSEAELIRWLNAELHKGQRFLGLTAAQTLAWLERVIRHLLDDRGGDLAILVRKRHTLADVLIPRIAEHGRAQVRKVAELLIQGAGATRLETSAERAFQISEQGYAPYNLYRGGYSFPKHAFDKVAAMRDEEAGCAKRIDDHPNVKRWVCNLVHESAGGFSLPLSPGRFYPDFIAELNDGRIAIVEYKGGHLAHKPEELHKKAVGELWANNSDGGAVFAWVVDNDWAALEAMLHTPA